MSFIIPCVRKYDCQMLRSLNFFEFELFIWYTHDHLSIIRDYTINITPLFIYFSSMSVFHTCGSDILTGNTPGDMLSPLTYTLL